MLQAAEQIDLMEQCGVLDDQSVGGRDRLTDADRLVIDAQKETTDAPMRSEPKLGNACECRPSANAATESSSAAVTTPCPPRPWIRT